MKSLSFSAFRGKRGFAVYLKKGRTTPKGMPLGDGIGGTKLYRHAPCYEIDFTLQSLNMEKDRAWRSPATRAARTSSDSQNGAVPTTLPIWRPALRTPESIALRSGPTASNSAEVMAETTIALP